MRHVSWTIGLIGGFLGCNLFFAGVVRSQEPTEEASNAKFQTTYIWQQKRPYRAAYSGANSLSPGREKSYSFTATAALGFRPWAGGEIYFNPEVAQGVPLSRLTGLGGLTNGEIARTSGPSLTLYRARLFLRQSWGYGGERERFESDFNRLAGSVDRRRLVLTAGNLSVLDLFDNNTFSHDPRIHFLNWSLMTHGAYDFAADARGYSWGIALEYFYDDWAFRGGRFLQPKQSNGLPLNPRIFDSFGDQIEVERAHQINAKPGKLRLLAFRNQAAMGGFRDALDAAIAAVANTGAGVPDLTTTRQKRVKYGFGASLEQNLSDAVGVFGRASWNNGEAETYAFTEIDRSVSGGTVVKGAAWGRPRDYAGIALVKNGLSRAHRDYLAAGGLGFFLGDGALRYKTENIVEAFYSVGLTGKMSVSLDFQRIANPGYNADRGPVSVVSLRWHAEY